MRILIQILDDPLATTQVLNVPEAQAHELKVLYYGFNAGEQKKSLVDVISGLISVGSDVIFREYIKRNLAAHFERIGVLWEHSAGKCFDRDLEYLSDRLSQEEELEKL